MLLATELFLALASGLLACSALAGSIKAWRHESHPVDFGMRILSCSWLFCLTVGAAQLVLTNEMSSSNLFSTWLVDATHEILLASLAFFLLAATGAVRPWVLTILGLQFVVGMVSAFWTVFNSQPLTEIQWASTALTLIAAASVTLSVTRQVRYTHSRRSWLVLAACGMGIGLWLYQASVGSPQQNALPVFSHLYALFVFVVWKLISLSADADHTFANPSTAFSGAHHFQTISGVNLDEDFISLAIRGERQRISHELHDNVGSQLVSVLFAMQSAKLPNKQFVMLSLEQCLSDLKMMVDALDSFDENVTQSLGRLRYRVQHALDRQGTKMHWHIDTSPELEAVFGIHAQQVLRIAQESLANVMRHAKATTVKVTCIYVPEFCHLLLEVIDNGCGIKKYNDNCPLGQGLAGMKRRAAAVGGILHISSHVDMGTCVRLTVPLPHLKLASKKVNVVKVTVAKETARA